MPDDFEWLNPPPGWSGDAAGLEVETGEKTDFWRETFYGFVRDTGHAWLAPVDGDFSLSARFRGDYSQLYDQAGLMLRRDDRTWIKTGIEFTDGLMHFSVVVTGPRSDWSVVPLPRGDARDRGCGAADPARRRGAGAVRARWWRLADGATGAVSGRTGAGRGHGLLAGAGGVSRPLRGHRHRPADLAGAARLDPTRLNSLPPARP